ncbi:MAG: hypothetical protein ABI210_08705, partial [Abditibacteriaceae bacterium]
MLVPYNVDRPAHKFPWVTYILIGLNVFVFLVTILVANVNLPSDRLLAQQDQLYLIQNSLSPGSEQGQLVAAIRAVYPNILPAPPDVTTSDQDEQDAGITPQQQADQQQVRAQFTAAQAKQALWDISLQLAAQQVAQPGGYDRMWRIQHMNDAVVWEPH